MGWGWLLNQNLEAMAKQLYDYWFVQFDFPNEEGKPYKSSGDKMVWSEKLKREIPKGWNVAKLADEIELQYGFPFSTELFAEQVTSVPVVRIRDILSNSISAYTTEKVEERYLLQKQDLLIGMDGNFHINYWTDNVSYLNQRSVRLRAKNNSNVSIVQAKYDIEPYIKAKEIRAKGSTVGHLSDKDMKELYVLVCPIKKVREELDSMLSMIVTNRNEITYLTKQRDELLPLLMNGQITIE
ncbi:MAG: restriction endonuclease subunit S [Bacteroidales bacterium]|nr:restriction endonuclease subunit S [Bacteroidales bacterium]